MPRNTLSDLNNHLFAVLERLNDEDLTEEEMKKEIERARAVNGVAKNIIENAKTALYGAKFSADTGAVPAQFHLKEKEDH